MTGTSGQVGKSIISQLGERAVALDEKTLDFLKPDELINTLKQIEEKHGKPKAFINPAAYTAVDKCEEEEELANKINAEAVEVLARYAFENDIPFVHYSTDYVFDGSGSEPRNEDEKTNPINAYGRSKLAGEEAIKRVASDFENAKWIIFRTSWVFEEQGNNFVNTMLRIGHEREVLSVINDQIGAPSYAPDLASATIKALEKGDFPSGIYNLCNSGETSWHGFAEEIFKRASEIGIVFEVKEVREIPTTEYPTPAARPLNSRLDLSKIREVFDIEMPSWQDALARFLKNKIKDKAA